MNGTANDRPGPFARLRRHFREAVAAARDAGRREHDRAIAEHGASVVEHDMPAFLMRWIDDHGSFTPEEQASERARRDSEERGRVAEGRALVETMERRRQEFEAGVIARATELGYDDMWRFRESDNVYPPERYEDNRVRLLGEMPDGTWADPEVAIAARERMWAEESS